jgi:Tol biopolymer transport system component
VAVAAISILASALAFPAMAGATFAGDDGAIVFHNQQSGGIYRINPGGRGLKFLHGGFEPSWSPSGKRIVFDTFSQTGSALKTMKADGTDVHTIINLKDTIWEPAWSPGGGQIVYRRGGARDAGNGDLWIVNTRGQNNHILVKNGANPDWSEPTASAPHGRIAFDRFPAKSPCYATEIYTVKPDGSNEQLLPFGCNVSFEPSWNPKATALAFASYFAPSSNSTDIFTGLDAGQSRSRLDDLADYDQWPAFSPVGARVVFANGLQGGRLYLVTLRHPFVETGIPNTKSLHAARPDWQPK